jgi:phosphoglycerate kinase
MKAKEFLTLDDIEVKDKTVLVRVDINSPFDEKTGKIVDNERIREHAKTIKELSDKGAKVVVLAHQGRKGDPDFLSLNQHAILLSAHTGKPIKFVDDIIGYKAAATVKSLRAGEILLLDNVRFLDEETQEKSAEEHSKSKLVQTLAPLVDIFVQDAFSACHRAHASIVGFPKVLPTYIGRVMENELKACERILNPEKPIVGIFGGAKVDDCLDVMQRMLIEKKLDYALTCGLVGNLFLLAKGCEIGKPSVEVLEKKGALKLRAVAKDMLEKYKEKILIPIDVAIEKNGKRIEIKVENIPADAMIGDIGSETIEKYKEIIRGAKTIVGKGPAGIYEKVVFQLGTKLLLEGVAGSKAYSLIGGGDLGVAIDKLGIDRSKFSYVSIAGGALITYLSGKQMPGIEVLKSSF